MFIHLKQSNHLHFHIQKKYFAVHNRWTWRHRKLWKTWKRACNFESRQVYKPYKIWSNQPGVIDEVRDQVFKYRTGGYKIKKKYLGG